MFSELRSQLSTWLTLRQLFLIGRRNDIIDHPRSIVLRLPDAVNMLILQYRI